MLSVWDISAPSGISLGVLPERREINLALPTTGSTTGVNFSVISGALPTGTYLSGNFLKGTTFEVNRPTTFTFVIRASTQSEVSDRTYSITVSGSDEPQWITPAGTIKVGEPELFYVLDNSYVDYQLNAIDPDATAGDTLAFFLKPNSGSLPPGLSLSSTGKITGFIDPILALDSSAGAGGYDTSMFDLWYFDFGKTITSLNDVGVPFNFNQRPQKKLNRYYQFTVSVSDGISTVNRTFKIFVVADNYLRADNADLTADSTAYTADNTYLRSPVWVTNSNLGTVRANNFKTILLEAKDPNPEVGPVVYSTVSSLPPNLYIDPATGELFGHIPYQPAITKEYSFVVKATKYDAFSVSEQTISIQVLKNIPYGSTTLPIRPLLPGEASLLVNQQLKIGDLTYIVKSYAENSFSGILTLKEPLVKNVIAGTELTKTVITPFNENGLAVSTREFYIKIEGEVDSTINWITPADLGFIRANTPSTSQVSAVSTVTGAVLSYSLVSGHLPPGITLSSTGNLVGIAKQFGIAGIPTTFGSNGFDNHQTTFDVVSTPGLTTFDLGGISFDNQSTTFDRKFTFTIKAKDQFNYSSITKTFSLTVKTPDDRRYTNIYVQPFLTKDVRTRFNAIINDTSIFTPEKIYRLGDPSFGLQTTLKMLVFPGIEVIDIDKYAIALSKNAKKRKYTLGNIKKAVAKQQGTNEVIYEVIYIDVLDPYENTHTSSPANTVLDRSNVWAPSNINNMQYNLSTITTNTGSQIKSEYEFLPSWMLTPQSAWHSATGFISAIPLAYCLPGTSDYILENISHANIDFSFINYEIDRLIIEDVLNVNASQYLLFNSSKNNI